MTSYYWMCNASLRQYFIERLDSLEGAFWSQLIEGKAVLPIWEELLNDLIHLSTEIRSNREDQVLALSLFNQSLSLLRRVINLILKHFSEWRYSTNGTTNTLQLHDRLRGVRLPVLPMVTVLHSLYETALLEENEDATRSLALFYRETQDHLLVLRNAYLDFTARSGQDTSRARRLLETQADQFYSWSCPLMQSLEVNRMPEHQRQAEEQRQQEAEERLREHEAEEEQRRRSDTEKEQRRREEQQRMQQRQREANAEEERKHREAEARRQQSLQEQRWQGREQERFIYLGFTPDQVDQLEGYRMRHRQNSERQRALEAQQHAREVVVRTERERVERKLEEGMAVATRRREKEQQRKLAAPAYRAHDAGRVDRNQMGWRQNPAALNDTPRSPFEESMAMIQQMNMQARLAINQTAMDTMARNQANQAHLHFQIF